MEKRDVVMFADCAFCIIYHNCKVAHLKTENPDVSDFEYTHPSPRGHIGIKLAHAMISLCESVALSPMLSLKYQLRFRSRQRQHVLISSSSLRTHGLNQGTGDELELQHAIM